MTTRPHAIGPYRVACAPVAVGCERVMLCQVRDLEHHVDRRALLADASAPEPPYWAYLWSGARLLAASLECVEGRVVELGCGLGLPGIVAARRGARVTFVDRVPVALAFVRASAAANRLEQIDVVAADFTVPVLRACFDLVLAAEILYDRAAFGPIARTLAHYVAPGGRALVADAGRIDTRAFHPALAAAGLDWQVSERHVREEGLPVTIRLLDIRRRA